MKRWKTGEIRDILGGSDSLWSVCVESESYGDTASRRLILYYDEDGPNDTEGRVPFVQVQGFHTGEQCIEDTNDCMIEMIEVTDDLGRGLQSSNKWIGRIYADAVTALRRAGFEVVPKMDDYF